ncbi:hypothetical protein [Nocardia asiatica]|uniref:hypothetical protein n=1 Tax=Nocardia asiatica TaxID=209252 RepID=UPI002453F20F|nr:hypothetical protein [Nocardia asiatica]
MSWLTPEPPADHYVWLGKVASACSMLEVQIEMIGWAWNHGQPWTDNWSEVAGSPGMARKLCEAALREMNPDLASEVSALLGDAALVREERNKFAHAVFILDPTRPAGDQWILKSARDVEFGPLIAEHGARLVATSKQLSRRAEMLRVRAVQERSTQGQLT